MAPFSDVMPPPPEAPKREISRAASVPRSIVPLSGRVLFQSTPYVDANAAACLAAFTQKDPDRDALKGWMDQVYAQG